MRFLTRTGLSFLDLIDFQEIEFSRVIDSIYRTTNTSVYKEVLLTLREHYSKASNEFGRNVVRYLLLNLREETLESVMPTQFTRKMLSAKLYLPSSCYPFERNPFISNLTGSKTSVGNQVKKLGLQDIQVRLLPAETMYRHYIDNAKMDICILNL